MQKRNLLALLLIETAGWHLLNAAGEDPTSAVWSVYTSLTRPACKTIEVHREGGNSTQKCPGIDGYHLLVLDSDARMSMTVVAPNGMKYPLEFWSVITPTFSTLGSKVEWRVSGKRTNGTPRALIVVVKANERPDGAVPTSYLAVAKLTPGEACVTAKIAPGPNAIEEARRAADASAEKPCLKR